MFQAAHPQNAGMRQRHRWSRPRDRLRRYPLGPSASLTFETESTDHAQGRGNGGFMRKFHLAIVFAASVATTPAFAARCGGDFNSFLSQMSADAQAAGISQATISQAFAGLTVDGGVLAFDRRQRYTFNKTFEQYVSTRVGIGRINGGRAMLQRHAALLSQIEQKFGVPRQILVAIWGLESDFGKGDMGKLPVIRTLATLAHDCRRTDLFQGELLAALKIVQRGDLPLRDLIGAYAGEIGQTQFLPSSYIKYGVDFDGDGRVDLRHSVADVLASTANLLHTNGFKMGQPYSEGSANFEAMREWNHAVIYRKTIGYFADQLVGR
jgi:lytic murein transglycosylase